MYDYHSPLATGPVKLVYTQNVLCDVLDDPIRGAWLTEPVPSTLVQALRVTIALHSPREYSPFGRNQS